MFRRIGIFLLLNIAVIFTISVILRLFNVQPYLNQHGLDYQSLLIFCFVWGMGGAFISLALSRKMAKWTMKIKIVHPRASNPQEEKLYNTVKRLAQKAKLKAIPEVGIFPSPQLNAFATGPTQKRSLVAVSSGLLQHMDDDELEGVLAHEIAHIANGDMVTMTLLQGVINAFVMFLARVLAFALSAASRSDSRRSVSGSYFMLVILFQFVFMILGSMIVCAYSRFREYRADRGGAKFSTKKNMIDALRHLQATQESKPLTSEAMQAFMIKTPPKSGLLKLFATHPPLEDRIEALQDLAK
ncbi:MAG: protease HtpX [Chlamydiales bacterium]|nr:protease HtpX [Chlamydiales bacterium]